MLAAAAMATGFAPNLAAQGAPPLPGGLKIVVVDVGQGSGLVLRTPDGTIHVVDAGFDGSGTAAMLPIIQSLQPQSFGFTFLSHHHSDHSGGLDEVLNAHPFTLAYDRGDVSRPSNVYVSRYLAAAGTRRRLPTLGSTIQLGGGVTIRVVAMNGFIAGGGSVPVSGATQEENGRSMALRLEYGDFSMWLAGDLTGGGNGTADVEGPAALSCGDVDVYLVDHHGSNTSSSVTMLNRLSPEVAIASAGPSNPFGHPTINITNRINQPNDAKFMIATSEGTGTIGFTVVGDATIETDGARYRITAQNGDFQDFFVDETTGPVPTPGGLRISEVQRNPISVSDNNGEYIEIMNTGTEPVALKGLRVSDNGGSFTIGANVALAPGKPFIVAQDGNPSRNAGLPFAMAWPFRELSLGDTSDTIQLRFGSTTIESLAYSAAYPGGNGIAMERRDALSAISPANFSAATAVYGGSDRGSPGRTNDADSTNWPAGVGITQELGGLRYHAAALDQQGQFGLIAMAMGNTPGTPFLNVTVPLTFDPLLQIFLQVPGVLDVVPATGYREMFLPLPAPPHVLQGLTVYLAHVVVDPIQATVPELSPSVQFTIQ